MLDDYTFEAGSAASSFLGGTLPWLMILAVVAVIVSLPTVRDTGSEHYQGFRRFFYGPEDEDDPAGVGAPGAEGDGVSEGDGEPEVPTGSARASDREVIDFDLSQLRDDLPGDDQ